MPITLNHTGFVVSNLEKSVAFYRDILGLEQDREMDAASWALSQVVGYDNAHIRAVNLAGAGGHILELIEYVNPTPEQRDATEQRKRATVGAAHLAFIVDDIDKTYEGLVSNGAQRLNPPVDVLPGLKACYMQDPDGNWIELVEDKEHAQQQFRIRQHTTRA